MSSLILKIFAHVTETENLCIQPEFVHLYPYLFFWAPKSLQMVTAAMKLKDAYSLEGKL